MFGNYSFAGGDIDGDGLAEYAMISTDGKYLLVLHNNGSKSWDAHLRNNNLWGTAPLCISDVDGDGRQEVLVPEDGGETPSVVVFDGAGSEMARLVCPKGVPDYDGAVVDSIITARDAGGQILVVALVNGGYLCGFRGLNSQPEWCVELSTSYFDHYLHWGDLDGDGADELAFTGHPNPGHDRDAPEVSFLHVCRVTGEELWKKPLSEIAPGKKVDHLDFLEIAPVVPNAGREMQIVASMGGCVMDARGDILWSLNEAVGHCDWVDVARTLARPRVLFSSHNRNVAALMADAEGNVLWKWEGSRLSADNVVTGQARFVDWTGSGDIEIVTGEQILDYTQGPGHRRNCTIIQTVNLYVLGLDGKVKATIPYSDISTLGWWYNGENRPLVLDDDDDGAQEWIWQSMRGEALVIKKDAH